MSRTLDAAAEAKRTGDWMQFVAAIPYARFLGLKVQSRQDDAGNTHLICHLPNQERIIGNPALPAIHGGALGALLECAAIFELIRQPDVDVLPRTVNLTIDYLRSAAAADTWASATVTRLGKRVASVHATAWQSSPAEPVASATVHLLVRE